MHSGGGMLVSTNVRAVLLRRLVRVVRRSCEAYAMRDWKAAIKVGERLVQVWGGYYNVLLRA